VSFTLVLLHCGEGIETMLGHSIVAGIIVLGILVFVHELGHFLVAKWLGVSVLKFSLGFGKKLIGRKWGETEYQIALVPLGGYVKLFGESPEEEVPESERGRSFTGQSILRRTAIVVAGPAMNLILTAVTLPFVFMVGIQQPSFLTSPPIIGWVEPDSPAAQMGFLPGDRILEINERPLDDWESLTTTLLTSPNEELTIAFERAGQVMSKKLVPRADPNTGAGRTGFQPDIPKMAISEVLKGKPAHAAGIQAGDIILSINGDRQQDYEEMRRLIEHNPGTPLIFEFRRGEEIFSAEVTPVLDPEEDRGKVGVAFVPGFPEMDFVKKRYPFFIAIPKGIQETARLTTLTFSVLGKFLTGKLSIRHLGGPITIVRFAGQAAESGFISLVQFVAFLSLNLAILNILPIPVLDGGHLAFLAIESVIGKPVSIRKQEMAYKIGFTILIALMVVVFYNDLVKMFFRFP
jgi:regulator of sigma E protease